MNKYKNYDWDSISKKYKNTMSTKDYKRLMRDIKNIKCCFRRCARKHCESNNVSYKSLQILISQELNKIIYDHFTATNDKMSLLAKKKRYC